MKSGPGTPAAQCLVLLMLLFSHTALVLGQAPLNDDCDGSAANVAFDLLEGSNTGFTNVGSSSSGVAPSCGSGNNDVWFTFTALRTCRHEVTTFGSGFDTVLAVFDGNGYVPGACGSLPELVCNDNTPASTAGWSVVEIDLSLGDRIFIQVSSPISALTGPIQVNIGTVYEVILDQPGPASPLQIDTCGGAPGASFFTAISLVEGSFPNGWFFGVQIPPATLLLEATFGPPFSGVLDGAGASSWNSVGPLPTGLDFYVVSLTFNFFGIPDQISAPLAYTTL